MAHPAAVAAADPAAPTTSEAPKGLFGRIGGYFDALNKTYTVDDKNAKPAEAQPAASIGNPSSINQPAAPSLITGPYSGEPTVVNVPPVFGDSNAAQSAPAAAEATKTSAAAAPAGKQEKEGLFDFLNKSYTIGGDKKAKPATGESAPEASTAETAPAAEPAATPATP